MIMKFIVIIYICLMGGCCEPREYNFNDPDPNERYVAIRDGWKILKMVPKCETKSKWVVDEHGDAILSTE